MPSLRSRRIVPKRTAANRGFDWIHSRNAFNAKSLDAWVSRNSVSAMHFNSLDNLNSYASASVTPFVTFMLLVCWLNSISMQWRKRGIRNIFTRWYKLHCVMESNQFCVRIHTLNSSPKQRARNKRYKDAWFYAICNRDYVAWPHLVFNINAPNSLLLTTFTVLAVRFIAICNSIVSWSS